MGLVRTFLAILAGSLLFSAETSAQNYNFSSLLFFGDSLTDEGRAGQTAPVMWPSVLRNDISVFSGENLAIGGATTSNQPSARFGDSSYLGQVNGFVTSGTPVANNTAAGIWIGTNNIWIGSAHNQPATALVQNASTDVRTGIQQLVAAGVHNILLLGVYDLSETNAYILAGANTANVRLAAASAARQYNAQLAALSVPGATITYFDIAAFVHQLQSNPRLYGFQRILPLQPGATCNAQCQQTSIFADTIHFSAKTQTLIGNYIASDNPTFNGTSADYGVIVANLASSNASAQVPLRLMSTTTTSFVSSLFDRLDAPRAARNPAAGPWSLFAFGNVLGGQFADVGSASGYKSAVDGTFTGVTAGAQYNATQNLSFGAAFNYEQADTNLMQSIGTNTRIDTYQGALYGSLSYSNWFIDSVATFGSAALHQTRFGPFGALRSSPGGWTATASAEGGELFPAGPIRIGPVLGLSYARTSIDAYREAGSSLYAVGFAGQDFDSLVGSAGIEARMADTRGWPLDPFVKIAYEHAFLSFGQGVSSYLANLPTQALTANDFLAGGDAVKATLGTSVVLAGGWSGLLTAYGLKGNQGLSAFGVNGGITHGF